MSLKMAGQFRSHGRSALFNMTPIIDIVFLLIIFFLVVCQFIGAENFPVTVPHGCGFAQSEPEPEARMTTVTVMKAGDDKVSFAVGPEKVTVSDYAESTQTQKEAVAFLDIVEKLAQLIDVRLKDFPPDRRVVTLRIDKDICFATAQYALAGIAQSSATDIQLAVLKDEQLGSE